MVTRTSVKGRRHGRLCSLDYLIMRKQTYITASEIGTYRFCKRAWHLGRIGIASASVGARRAGSAWHEEHASRVTTARRSRRMAQAFGLAFLVLVLLLILIWVRRR